MSKNVLIFLGVIGSLITLKAQTGNLVIFSDEGSKFFVVVNGLRVNDQAQTNVKVTGLNADYVNCKIVFENELTPDIEKKTMMLVRGHEVTYIVKKNKKGETVCNAYSDVELNQAVAGPNQQTVVYTNVPYNDGTVIRTGNASTTTTTTTTTTTNGNTNVTNTNVGVNGLGMNVTIYDNTGTGVNGTSTTTTTYSSTTTTDGTYSNNNTNGNYNNNCIYGMSSSDLNAAKNSMNSTSFDDTKVSTFKQIVSGKCIITSQVKELLQIFSFEDNKLDMAKYAYSYVADPSNYYTINDIFAFDSNKSELSNYVTNNRR